ncbi:hypothetical protein B0T16DRAFT_143312 [Cercophora newfieldiana]|uniref:Uncharacterized protein n=1 Tax=Cercophora newfieldiana TaxID=92897 RepID=A0AA39Y4L0_9PEZI|nr:hypothetical protein B0T16DRAFT_143312 [Cercophora newfieldiana]
MAETGRIHGSGVPAFYFILFVLETFSIPTCLPMSYQRYVKYERCSLIELENLFILTSFSLPSTFFHCPFFHQHRFSLMPFQLQLVITPYLSLHASQCKQ